MVEVGAEIEPGNELLVRILEGKFEECRKRTRVWELRVSHPRDDNYAGDRGGASGQYVGVECSRLVSSRAVADDVLHLDVEIVEREAELAGRLENQAGSEAPRFLGFKR